MIIKKLAHIFTLDIRGLSIMRILLGVVSLWDLCFFAYSLINQIIPTDLIVKDFFYQNLISLYSISDNTILLYILLIVHAIIGICYTLGYKTKYTAPLFWLFTCSIHGANTLFTNAGSGVARLLIGWSIFLPINKIYSLDSGWSKDTKDSYKVNNIATRGIGLQLLYIYFFSYFFKTSDARRTEFSAIYYALSRDYYSSSLGYWLTNNYTITQILTIFTLFLELLGPILYLVLKARGKIVIAMLFILLHLGFIVTMRLGSFPFYCIAGCITLLPPLFRNTIQKTSDSQNLIKGTNDFWFKNSFTNIFLIFIIVYTLARNIRSTNYNTREKYFPTGINKFSYILRLDQYRAMYAPHPGVQNGWHQINGLMKNKNTIINLSNPDQPLYTTKPTHTQINQILPKIQWVNLVMGTLTYKDPNGKYSDYFTQYLCRERNNNHAPEDFIKAVQIIYVQETITLKKTQSHREEKYLGTWSCKT